MTITFIDGAQANNPTAVATYTVPVPSAGGPLVAGDMLIAAWSWATPDTTPPARTLPTGWTSLTGIAIAGTATTTVGHEAAYHFVTAGEAGTTPTWTVDNGGAYIGNVSVSRFRGVDAADPFAMGSPFFDLLARGTNSTSTAAPSVATDANNALLVTGFGHRNGSGTITQPTGFTMGGHADLGAGRTTALAHKLQPVPGSSGTATWTHSNSVPAVAWQTALNPSSAVTAPVVNAGVDATVMAGYTFARTANESDGGAAITARAWTIVSGPAGAGSTIGTAAALSWMPTVAGSYVLRYSASNSVGTTTDDVNVTVDPLTSDFARVQFASGGSFTSSSLTHTSGDLPTLGTPATAGNTLIGVWAVDKNSGAFTPPAGWTVLGEITGTSISMLVCGKVAAGGETTATATWATATEGHSALLVEYTGTTASPFGPINAPAYSDLARTSMSLGPVTATANSRAIAIFDIDSIRSGGAQLDFHPAAAGWGTAIIGQAPVIANGIPGAALTETLSGTANTGVVPATTFTWTPSDQVNGMMLLLNTQGTGGGTPAGTFVFTITGDPDGDSVPVRVKTDSALSVRLKVATNSAMSTGVAFTTPVAPDANQYSLHTVSGLAAGTHYWYQVEVDGVLAAPVGEFITDTPATARSFRVAFASCLTSDNSTRTALDNAIENDPELFLHLGDWHYDNSISTSAGTHRTSWEDQININGGLRDLIRQVPLAYTWSDHDSGNDNWTGGPAAWTPSYNSAYRDVFPVGTAMPNSGGIYRSIHRGRVKFIMTDGRSFKSPSGNTDDASKTMFGTAQEAWIASELADPNYPVKVLCVDVPWVFPTTAGEDKWGGYKAAAQRLVNDINAAGARVFLIHGDAHSLCADNGSSASNTGGLPVAGAAPLGNTTSIKGGPYSQGTYPSSGSIGTTEQQHGLLDITDNGNNITIRFSGRDKTNTERITLTKTWTLTEPSAGQVRVGGSAIQNAFVGGTPVDKMYLGPTQVWP